MQDLESSSPASTSLMGIINVTPDSFHDGGEYNRPELALERASELMDQGVDLLDLGGVSTRPGAPEVSVEAEKKRVLPVLEALGRDETEVPVSVDTSRVEVAEKALGNGAELINDVTALRSNPELAGLLADSDASLVLMHMQGSPQTMQEDPDYDDVVEDICDFFEERIDFAVNEGVSEDQIILDPGIGFGKTLEHNGRIFRNLDEFKRFGLPLLVGHSRKSYLGELLESDPETSERLPGTLATSVLLMLDEVDVIRVHDAGPHRDLRRVVDWLATGR